MKEFFRQHGLRILAVAAAVAVALSLLTYFSSTSSVLENIAGVLTYPFRAAATAVSDWAADKRQYYEDTTTLKEENAALKKEIADLRAQQRQAQADSEENKLLRELLKLQQQRRDFTFVSTAVLAHSESSWTSSLSLNHGTDQDIAVGDCVVSAEGYLVGVISEVGLNWSTVLTVIDTDTELGARIFRTGEVAVAEGDFSLMGQGKLKLSYLTSDDQVLIGDQIVTSGLGGYYPSGLVIGSQTTALKWTFYALAAAALLFLRRLLLGSMTFFGVIPFLPPVILAVMASFELPRSSVIAGIVFGALCDLVLPAPFACLYTIAFTLAALLISTVVSNLLQQGFARALLSTVLTFLLVDLLQAFALLPRSGSTAILSMLHLFARETALSCLLLAPVYPALRAVRRAFPD